MKYKKICKCCGMEFETNSPQKLFCDRDHYLPCPVCGKPVKKLDRDFTRPPKCCSDECTHILRQKSFKPKKCVLCGKEFIPKSGVQIICDDLHKRICPVCGKEFEVDRLHIDVKTCSKECQWKQAANTCVEKYGADHPMRTKIGQIHHQQSMEKKYGKKFALQIPEFQEKLKQTQIERYGVPYYCTTQECADALAKSDKHIVSQINRHFGKLLEENSIPYKFEKRLDNRSFDIEIIDRNILVEIDPTITHSTVKTIYEPIEKNYHLEKSEIAKKYGFTCIHIFDWDNLYKIIELIKPLKSIYARKCKVDIVNPDAAKQFIIDNHIQGSCYGQEIFIGLYHENVLYQIMSFGKSRYDKHHKYELLRLCSLSGHRIIGGASKLFKYAVETFDLNDVISYCDKSKFTGSVYTSIGMKLLRNTPPQEIWSKETKHISANLLRQRGFDQLFKTDYGKGTSNEQLMLNHGWLPIYDCGQAVYLFER